jgi:hypothetical protein
MAGWTFARPLSTGDSELDGIHAAWLGTVGGWLLLTAFEVLRVG